MKQAGSLDYFPIMLIKRTRCFDKMYDIEMQLGKNISLAGVNVVYGLRYAMKDYDWNVMKGEWQPKFLWSFTQKCTDALMH